MRIPTTADLALLATSIIVNLIVGALVFGTGGPEFILFGVIGGVAGAILHKWLNSAPSSNAANSRLWEKQIRSNSHTWALHFDWRRRNPHLR
jgi:uncharacterized membrane protein YedE/YeeE